jgi:hypothetical protein
MLKYLHPMLERVATLKGEDETVHAELFSRRSQIVLSFVDMEIIRLQTMPKFLSLRLETKAGIRLQVHERCNQYGRRDHKQKEMSRTEQAGRHCRVGIVTKFHFHQYIIA